MDINTKSNPIEKINSSNSQEDIKDVGESEPEIANIRSLDPTIGNSKDGSNYKTSLLDGGLTSAPHSSHSRIHRIRTKYESDAFDKKPPDFALAARHRQATLVRKSDNLANYKMKTIESSDHCECCRLPIGESAPKYSLFVNLYKLMNLGIGVPLYFYFFKYVAVLLLIMSCLVAIPGLLICYSQGNGDEWVRTDSSEMIVNTSIGSFGRNHENYENAMVKLIIACNTIVIILIYIMNIVYSLRQDKMVAHYDEKFITPDDYTVFLTHLPPDKTKDELTEWVLNFFPDFEIQKINFTYDIREVVDVIRKLNHYKYLLRNYEEHNKKFSLPELTKKIDILQTKMDEFKDCIDNGNNCLPYRGKAFIVFNKQSQAQKFVEIFNVFWVIKLIDFVILKWNPEATNKRYWDGYRIGARKAPDPTDIFWENLGISLKTRLKYRLVTWSLVGALLTLVYFISLGLNQLKDFIDRKADAENNITLHWIIRGLSLLNTILIIIVNALLRRSMRIITTPERDETYTRYNRSVAYKLFIVTFINTGLIPFFANLGREDWFDEGGLVIDMYLNIIAYFFFAPIFFYFNGKYVIRKLKIAYHRLRGRKCNLTQREANELYEGPPMDFAKGISDVMIVFALTAFYTPLLPGLSILAVFAVLIRYCIEKYKLLRVCRKPEALSDYLAKEAILNIPFIMFIYAFGQYIFIVACSKGENQVCLPVMILTILYYFIPKDYFLSKWKSRPYRSDEQTYEIVNAKFRTDYDRENPLSSKEATINHLKSLERISEDGSRKQILHRLQTKVDRASKFTRLSRYSERPTLGQHVKRAYGHTASQWIKDLRHSGQARDYKFQPTVVPSSHFSPSSPSSNSDSFEYENDSIFWLSDSSEEIDS